jgi:hypothetical protein
VTPVILLLAVALSALPRTPRPERVDGPQNAPAPAIVVGARYPASAGVDQMRVELPALAAAGYNAVTARITWREGEPQRGIHHLLPLDQLVAVASNAGLGVRIQVVTSLEPEWKKDGTNALAGTFFDYVRRRFERRPGVLAVLPEVVPTTRVHRTITVGNGGLTLRAARLEFWAALASGARSFDVTGGEEGVTADVLAFGETIGVVTRNEPLFAPLQERQKDDLVFAPAERGVSATLLESAQAFVIVALNRTTEVRQITITFPRDIPEAIWQNMEHGNSVHFVTGPSGPVLEHTFRPQDVLVLAIRKTLR